MFDEDNQSVRSADQYYQDQMVGGVDDMAYYEELRARTGCCSFLCGTPTPGEPKISLGCFSVSKRVLKNIFMFLLVLVAYCTFLYFMMSERKM